MQKTILITGVTSWFGKAIMEKFLSEGHRVIWIGRRKERLDEIQSTYWDTILTREVDITSTNAIEDFFNTLPSDWINIDALINNAGLALGIETAQDAKIADWDAVIDVNIRGLMHMTHYVLKLMSPKNAWHIINIGSVSAHTPYKWGNVYGATKAFVRQFSRNLRTDLLGTKIRVTNIEPGKSETEFSVVRFCGDEDRARKVYEWYEFIRPEDVAEAVYFAFSQPNRVNIDNMEIRGIDEAMGGILPK
jgi:3-hydroxy acid dehydrogenase / malonic semialdehyde reductase